MEHLREVAALLHDADASDEVVAAGVLHDTVELTRATLADVEERFGTEVEGLVSAVTEDPSIRSYGQRKAALHIQAVAAGRDAAVLFAADKLSKVREYRAQLARAAVGGTPPRPRRLNHYAASLVALERIIPGHPLVVELRKELTPLAPLPAVEAATNQDGRSPSHVQGQ